MRCAKSAEGFALERARHLENKRTIVLLRLREDTDMLDEHRMYKTRVLLPRIAAALERVRDGTYGVCLACGEPIPHARLERLPEAPCCVECQEEADHAITHPAPL
ncbi:MAG: TraR/DksA C4-type zinc finger protein [Candidatus Uhrbacteria bacterium]